MEDHSNVSTTSTNFTILSASDYKAAKKRDRAFSNMNYLEYVRNYGVPPPPLVKPQNAPTENLGEMELPPSELIDKDFRKILSCPIYLNAVQEEDGLDVDEEEERDKVYLPDKLPNINKPDNILGSLQENGDNLDDLFKNSTRYRSRSENLNNGSIFKFMEGALGGRREQSKATLLF